MEKDNEIIYDLTEASAESAAGTSVDAALPVENAGSSVSSEESCQSECLELSQISSALDNQGSRDDSESSEKEKSPAETEIDRMIDEVGAETLLEIIRDNRNAAIRQIISEVESSQQSVLRSGVSIAKECNSIFDLAALA
ncbi:MAG: hypothetical protein K2O47_00700 [Muribaculaceae bacterium]|nr:hypothetical protein [Muribaculaceae bacterium]